jgi:hypothetical protein
VSTSTPVPDVVDEARRVMEAAASNGVVVRLIGGVAVRVRADSRFHPALARDYQDIDVVTLRGRQRAVSALLADLGYEPNEKFNAMHGHDRLMFGDVANRRRLDVFVGAFRMCHEVPLARRIELEPLTVPLAELLLTKLQVFELNEKDVRDTVALMLDHDVAEHDGDAINAAVIAGICAEDWGLWRTCKLNVERVGEGVAQYPLSETERGVVGDRLSRLWDRIEREPKSRGWRLRDRIGDRKRWYDEPEEV